MDGFESMYAKLAVPVPNEDVSSRTQSGKDMHYIEGYKVIDIANDIFGPLGWSQEIVKFEVISSREITRTNQDGTSKVGWEYGVSCLMRITINDYVNGNIVRVSVKEDVGVGTGVDYNSPVSAYESAAKEAATDAMKRAFRSFGVALGNCLYDKQYREENFGNKKSTYTKREYSAPQTQTQTVLATDAQKGFINRLLTQNGATLDKFTSKALDALTKGEAGDVITKLQQK